MASFPAWGTGEVDRPLFSCPQVSSPVITQLLAQPVLSTSHSIALNGKNRVFVNISKARCAGLVFDTAVQGLGGWGEGGPPRGVGGRRPPRGGGGGGRRPSWGWGDGEEGGPPRRVGGRPPPRGGGGEVEWLPCRLSLSLPSEDLPRTHSTAPKGSWRAGPGGAGAAGAGARGGGCVVTSGQC